MNEYDEDVGFGFFRMEFVTTVALENIYLFYFFTMNSWREVHENKNTLGWYEKATNKFLHWMNLELKLKWRRLLTFLHHIIQLFLRSKRMLIYISRYLLNVRLWSILSVETRERSVWNLKAETYYASKESRSNHSRFRFEGRKLKPYLFNCKNKIKTRK